VNNFFLARAKRADTKLDSFFVPILEVLFTSPKREQKKFFFDSKAEGDFRLT
jgi:hypothetical protein